MSEFRCLIVVGRYFSYYEAVNGAAVSGGSEVRVSVLEKVRLIFAVVGPYLDGDGLLCRP